jgi:Oxidoreductase molybdopterin binding domain
MTTVFRCAAIVVTTCMLVVGGTATARSDTPSPVVGAVNIWGDARKPTTLSLDALRGLPPQTQSVTFQSSMGPQSHTYVGPTLIDIVTAADPAVDPADHHALLPVVVVATGAGNYTATVAWGEISPPDFAATPVLVAYTVDGNELDQPRLVVPGDIRGGRYVRDLAELRVVNLAQLGYGSG